MKYSRGDRPRYTLITTVFALMAIGTACASPTYSLAYSPTPYVRDDPTEYYLYLPGNYSPDHEWPVFVGIHGFGGSGRDCLSMWQTYADQAGFVLLCPSLADEGGGWYQAEGEAVLSKILEQVAQECRVQKRIFLAGFSAGATFVQGFAFAHPDLVAAVATLSAGNYYAPASQAQGVIFLVVIGDRDNPVGIQGAESFTEALKQGGFSVELHVLPGVGHTASTEAKDLTIKLFERLFRK